MRTNDLYCSDCRNHYQDRKAVEWCMGLNPIQRIGAGRRLSKCPLRDIPVLQLEPEDPARESLWSRFRRDVWMVFLAAMLLLLLLLCVMVKKAEAADAGLEESKETHFLAHRARDWAIEYAFQNNLIVRRHDIPPATLSPSRPSLKDFYLFAGLWFFGSRKTAVAFSRHAMERHEQDLQQDYGRKRPPPKRERNREEADGK